MKVEYLTDEEYHRLGLSAGLEIHQQIKTSRKLFCRCPVIMHKDDDFDAVVMRHMRPTLSELGEYDGTALMEFKTKKEVVYQLFRDCVCTYEMDDTPPFLINQQAVQIALKIALLLGCTMIDEIHITRKQYLDGSIPTGFQRTAIVGINGAITHRGRKIRVRQLGLEEDACREVSDVRHRITFKTDRLGIPLVEVVTEPDMRTPLEVQGVAEQIGMALKGTGLVYRGIGTVRQDVNVSIRGSTRVEIKGVSKVSLIGPLVHFEALRQKNLLGLKDELARRGISKSSLRVWEAEILSLVPDLGSCIIKEGLQGEQDCSVVAVGLGGFRGLLGYSLQPGKPFGYEVSQRIKVIACLDGEPNILWNDRIQRTGDLSDAAWAKVFSVLSAGGNDAVILVWGNRVDVRTAVSEIRLRLEDAIDGVPNETRQPYPDGTTGFERILPGPNRMYPDTDLPPLAISPKRLQEVRDALGPNPFQAYERFRQMGLGRETTNELMRNRRWRLFERITKELKVAPRLVAAFLTERLTAFRRLGLDVERLSDDDLFAVFKAYAQGKLSKEGIGLVVKELLTGTGSVQEAIERFGVKRVSDEELASLVESHIRARADLVFHLGRDRSFRLLMGEILHSRRGKVEADRVAAALRSALQRADELA